MTLKERRISAGLTREELASMADVNDRTLEAYEQGRKSLAHASSESILNLALCLDCDPREMCDGNKEVEEKYR